LLKLRFLISSGIRDESPWEGGKEGRKKGRKEGRKKERKKERISFKSSLGQETGKCFK
jgi:hypothetical protein